MKHAVVYLALLTLATTACTEFFKKRGDPRLYNGKNSNAAWAVKFFYERDTAKYSSTGFVVGSNVLLTSGHSLKTMANVIGGPQFPVKNFQLPKESGNERTDFTPKVIYSVDEWPRNVFRNGFSQIESWEMGVLVLGPKANNGAPLKLPPPVATTRWPIYEKLNFKIVGTGAHDVPVDDPFNSVVKQEGFFKVESVNDQIITYDMSIPGTPLTAVGDSGAALAFTDDGKTFFAVGAHNGNYANGATGNVSNGYASSLFFPNGRTFWKKVMQAGGRGVEMLYAHSTFLDCLNNSNSSQDLSDWLPIDYYVHPSTLAPAFLAIKASSWTKMSAFEKRSFTQVDGSTWSSFLPTKVVDLLKPGLFGELKSATIELAHIRSANAQCAVQNKKTLSLQRAALFSEIKWNHKFVAGPNTWQGDVTLDAKKVSFSDL